MESETITLENDVPRETVDLMKATQDRFNNNEDPGLFDIKSSQDYQYAVDTLKDLKGSMKAVAEVRKNLTTPFETAKKALIARFKPFEQWGADTEVRIKSAMGRYDDEQERKRQLAQAEADAKAQREADRLRARADKAAEKGNLGKAEALDTMANATIAEQVTGQEKTAGVSNMGVVECEINDLDAFLQAAAANPFLKSCIEVDTKKLAKLAQQLGDDFEVPGVLINKRRSYRVRA